jgi:hypothetical protein
MTPDAQRIAIAEACGWVEHEINSDSWYKNSGHKFSAPTGTSPFLGRHSLPDYLTDLNAMHEAEKGLTDDQQKLYIENLMNDEPTKGDYCNEYLWDSVYAFCTHATAADRAKAFLKTIGKWEASK